MQIRIQLFLRRLLIASCVGLVGAVGFINYRIYATRIPNKKVADAVYNDQVTTDGNDPGDPKLSSVEYQDSLQPIIPAQYGSEYMKIQKYNYLVNSTFIPRFCYRNIKEYNESILAIVNSVPEHFKERQQVRSTWANPNYTHLFHLRALFLVANPESVQKQHKLLSEAKKYQDIIIADYIEQYRKLLYKILLGFRYVMDNCQKFTYLLKTDDDCYINVFIIREQVSNWRRKRSKTDVVFDSTTARTLFCEVRYAETPRRSTSDKYYVSEVEFDRLYPERWCPGNFYLVTFDMIPIIYWATLNTTCNLHLDDVLMTGVVLENINLVRYVQWHIFSSYDYIYPQHPKSRGVMYVHGMDYAQREALFDAIVKPRIKSLMKLN